MIRPILAIAAASLALPAAAQPAVAPSPAPALSLEQTMLLRCSAAFALVAGDQQRGKPAALAYPPLALRGQEFFVRAGARLMDERSIGREQFETMVRAEAAALNEGAARAPDPARFLDGIMQPCLVALDASGL